MVKKILAIILLIVNLNNAPKTFTHLFKGISNPSDIYHLGKGITYFFFWVLFFYLIFRLWKWGDKKDDILTK